jgi:hypothetical protein
VNFQSGLKFNVTRSPAEAVSPADEISAIAKQRAMNLVMVFESRMSASLDGKESRAQLNGASPTKSDRESSN